MRNHSMNNAGLANVARQDPNGLWEELPIAIGQTLEILLFSTYCPGNFLAFSVYPGFDFPYTMPAGEIFIEPPLWALGHLTGNGLINEEQAVIAEPTITPARGRTKTNSVEVYGWYTQVQPLPRGIAIGGNPLSCTLWLQWLASAATVRTHSRALVFDGTTLRVNQPGLIPEPLYTQAIQDQDNHNSGYAAPPAPPGTMFESSVAGIYRVF